jgi:cytidylate kinase
MTKKIIIIEGYLASGKSTFATQLSNALNIPYLVKDTLKIALCSGINIQDRGESSRFSTVAFNAMMYMTQRLLETGIPLIIEGNFVPAGIKSVDEAGVIRTLIDQYSCQSLTYKFMGDTHILHKRFVDRENTPERGEANKMFNEVSYRDFDRWCRNFDAFDVGGKVVQVDTTDFSKVDFQRHIETAHQFFRYVK